MSTTVPTSADAAPAPIEPRPMGLAARAINVLFAPRQAYEAVVARPRIVGVLVLVIAVIATAQFVFLSTDVGQNALLDQQLGYLKAFNVNITDAMVQQMESRMANARYTTAASLVVFVPLMIAIMSGLLLAIFTVISGTGASFKQMYAIVAHSYVIGAVQQVFSLPINYVRGEMTSPTSMAVFFPMLDDQGFAHYLLGAIDLFYLWSIFSVAIGVAVLYKRPTGGVAAVLLGIYAVIAIAIAGWRAL